MSERPSAEYPTMRLAAPEDEVTVRYALPGALAYETESGLEIHTCRGGVIAVPRSVLSSDQGYVKAGGAGSSPVVVIEARTRRDAAELLGNLIAEIVRLSR